MLMSLIQKIQIPILYRWSRRPVFLDL